MTSQPTCIFCRISRGEDDKTEILYNDEDTVVFRDMRPASTHHYLVVPKQHIQNPKSLDQSHVDLVKNLVATGNKVLLERKGDLTDTSYGFHWPPFTTVSHLHLHVISPTQDMGFIARGMFRPNSYWFVSADWMIERLQKMGKKKPV